MHFGQILSEKQLNRTIFMPIMTYYLFFLTNAVEFIGRFPFLSSIM